MRIKYYRKLRGMTQCQLAERVGVTQAYICNLESGQRANPSFSLLVKIAHALNTTLEELVNVNEAM